MTSVSSQIMTEVSVLENGQSPGNSDASKTMLMMSRPSAGFPSPPYNSPSHQPIKEEDEEEEENFPENSSSSSPPPQQNSLMEVDRMNHQPDDEQDDQHGRNNDDDEQENENSMDSYVREDYAGKTVKSLLEYNKNAAGRRGAVDEEVTEDEEEEEEDDEGKLVIDANDQILQQAAAQQQQLLEAKLRCSAGIVGPGNKSSSSRPSSASPRGSPGALHGGQANSILNMMMTSGTMSKDRLAVNGHGQQSHQLSRSSYHQNHHNDLHSSQQHHHHHERHPYHNSHHRHGSSNHVRSHPRSEMLKSERKSARSPLIECDVKSEGLQNSLNASSIGNALLNLASLGSLASIPNLLPSSTTSSNSSTSSSTENLSRSLSGILSQQAGQQASPLFSAMNTPLNLTNSNGSNGSNSYGSNALNNTLLTSHLAQLISQQNNNLLTNNLLNSAALAASASSSALPVGSNTHNGSSNSNNSTGPMPQLLLASGQIVQGIQGAQLLIPTSGGLMSQTILTIPLNQPGAVTPPSSYPSSVSPQLPAGLHHHHHHQSSSHHQPPPHHHHHGARGHPISPPVAPTVPPAASPDFSDHPSALPAPNLNLGPHSVGSQMGAHIPMVHDKLSDHSGLQQQQQQQHRSPSRTMINGNNNRREMNTITTNGGLSISAMVPQGKSSPCNSSHDSDAFSDNDDSDQMVDGINLDEIKEFAKAFKLRRLSLGLTQTQVGQALSVTEGPAYSQSAICSALAWQLAQSQTTHSNRTSIPQPFMFEKLDITPKSAQKIKPVLERWMKEAEDRYKNGHQNLNDFVGMEPSKKRKRRTSFTPQALEILNTHFDRNTHPSGAEITTLAHQLGYEREVIRIWFCNKRQALKNTVRMMSKGSSPM